MLREDVEKMLSFLREKVEEFERAQMQNFREHINMKTWRAIRSHLLDQPGVYVIYDGDRIIYVGATEKEGRFIRYSIGDLFYYRPPPSERFKHSLTRKLIEKYRCFTNIQEVRDYYIQRCSFKVVGTPTSRDAKLLEAALTRLLKPHYAER